MTKTYYTLTVQEAPGEPFAPQFGDYNKGVVAAEVLDYCERGYKPRQLAVIKSGDTQPEIDTEIAKFNAKHANTKPLTDQERSDLACDRAAAKSIWRERW